MLVGAWAQLYRRHLREVEWLHEHHQKMGLLNSAGLLKQLDPVLSRPETDQRFIASISHQLNNFLEITESAVMSDPEHCIRLIGELRDRGYGVATDDFGVGHSSLSYLQKLRVSTLKIDQEFVRNVGSR